MSAARDRFRKQAVRRPARKTSPHAARLAIIGTLLVITSLPLNMLSAQLFAMAMNATSLEHSKDVSAIIESLSRVTHGLQGISQWFAVGQSLLLTGCILVTWALQWGRLRTRWFFWMTFILALVLLVPVQLIVPLPKFVWLPNAGIFFALWWLWCLFWSRDEFQSKARKAIPA